MNRILKRVFAVVLTVAMLLGTVTAFASTVAEGNNGKTIYFSFEFYDEYEEGKITSVAANESFFVYVNFAGNPKVANDSIQGYNLLIGYDNKKVSFPYGDESFLGELNTPLQMTTNYGNGIALVQGVANGGIKKGFSIATSGTLFKLFMTATVDLTEDDLKEIALVSSTGISGKEDTYVIDGIIPAGEFTVVQAPVLTVGEVAGDVYTDATAADVKGLIQSFSYIDTTGTTYVFTKDSDEFADLEVVLPASGLTVGKNVVSVKFYGATADINVNAVEAAGDPGTNTILSNDNKTFTITPSHISAGNTVILALYGANGLVDLKSFVYNGSALTYTTSKNYVNATVYVWENFTTLIPVCEPEYVK